MTRRRWVIATLAVVALLLVVGRLVADVFADYAWYDALGQSSVWRIRVGTIAIARLVAWFAASVFALAHLLTVRASVAALVVQRKIGNLEFGEKVHGRYLTGTTAALAVIVGGALALAWTDWTATVLARSGSMFHEFDPYFRADLGFFVYRLPFEAEVWSWSLKVVLTVLAVVTILYILTDGLRWESGRLHVSAHTRRHLTVMAGLLLLMIAWSFRLDMYELLLEGSGPNGMFTFVDNKIGIIGSLILAVAMLAAGLVVIAAGIGGQFRIAATVTIGVVALWIVVREVLPVIAGQAGTDHDRQVRDHQYLKTQAGYTRRAFAADSQSIAIADPTLSIPSMDRAASLVPVWDPPAIRRIVQANAPDDTATSWFGWHATPSGLLADIVVKPAADDDQRLVWSTSALASTTADASGDPLLVSHPGLRHESVLEQRPLRSPIVYPGASGYLVVADTSHQLFGVSLESTATRLAYAWSFQNLRFMGRSLPALRPMLVAHRDVRDRLARLAPFFTQGSVVSPAVTGDSLYWIVDLYSSSAWYPLSYHIKIGQDEWAYFQHAAIGLVNATTGLVVLVPDAKLDPIATSWMKRFPSLFGSWNELPSGIRGGIPPPVDGARAQAIAYGRFGGSPDEGVRHLPDRDGSDSSAAAGEPLFEIPNGTSTAVAFPLLDDDDRVRGAIVAVGGQNRRTAWQPAHDSSERWTSIIEQLRALDSVGASHAETPTALGRVRALPVGGHLAYVQPAYTWHAGAGATLAYVAYLEGDTARRVPVLDELSRRGLPLPASATGDLLAQAAALWAAMADAARRSDWVAWGRAFDALGRLLQPHIRP